MRPISRHATVLALLLLSASSAAAQSSVTVSEIAVAARDGNTIVAIRTSAPAAYQVARQDAPARIVVDLPDTAYQAQVAPLRPTGDAVREVRGSQHGPAAARVAIELARPSDYLVVRGRYGLGVVLLGPDPWHTGDVTAAAARAAAMMPSLAGIARGVRGWVAYLEDPATRTVAGYRVGDTVADRTVEAIDGRRVILAGPAERVEMRLDDVSAGSVQRQR
jgi:hypothetical protein